jgi:hypothetical protein
MKFSSIILSLPLVSAAVLDTRQTSASRAGAPLDTPVATMRKGASRKYFTFGRKFKQNTTVYCLTHS